MKEREERKKKRDLKKKIIILLVHNFKDGEGLGQTRKSLSSFGSVVVRSCYTKFGVDE